MKSSTDRIQRTLFILSAICLIFLCGILFEKYKILPEPAMARIKGGFHELLIRFEVIHPWYYRDVKDSDSTKPLNSDKAYAGLNLVTRIGSGRKISVEIMDMDGNQLHEWNVDWFRVWPNPHHIPARYIPKSKPGTHVHGAVVLNNGSLVFNYDYLGTVCLNIDGEVVWRLPYRTHHSIHQHDDGNLWICGQKRRVSPHPSFPGRKLPFDEYTILEVSPEGKKIREWSVSDILYKNNLSGLQYLGSDYKHKLIEDDFLHLNDVEPFPSSFKEGFFKKGDVLVSLRNINTVFVFNRATEKIKFISTGMFVWQHDPDFIDGNTISVFDNNKISMDNERLSSRIVVLSAPEKTFNIVYEGNAQHPFYSDIMGKHQWLPNGNLLITESMRGRAFELDPRGDIVWQYVNKVDEGVVGLVEEVQRLPPEFARIFNKPPSSGTGRRQEQ